MTDIFISYAREDEMRVRELVQALEEHGWSIFWDRRIPAGKTWESYIGQALSDARCVIVAWSHHSGARVIAITSSPEKVDQAVRLGAEVGVDRRSVDPLQAVGHITDGRGADLVLDSVGQVTWRPALERLANGGRLVTVGRTSGRLAETDVREVFWRKLEIIGSTMASQSEFDAVMDVAFAGRLRPVIDSVHSLSDAADGYRLLDSGQQFGKVIIRVNE